MSNRKLHVGDSLFPEEPFSQTTFPTNYESVLDKIEKINAFQYAKTRNFINGAVTYLSPYISRGVISLPFVQEKILEKYSFQQAEKLIQELAWREYFQRIWQYYGDAILKDIKQTQPDYIHCQIPKAIVEANTTIKGIDDNIKKLYETGYMHNHTRMYTAMLTCNIAKSHWLHASQWMYYHLLDGDIASNTLSWQWVAASFSNKKYYANQENINKYCGTEQLNTYLDTDYELLKRLAVPNTLQTTTELHLTTNLTIAKEIYINQNIPTLIYNSYNIDPLWHKNETCNRILLLEPSHYKQFPISQIVLQFVIQLAKENIPSVQIFVGEFNELKAFIQNTIHYKEHPTTQHYQGIQENRDWLFPEVKGNFSSFFSFWKKCEKYLK
jgi:deoxyribodipyrimidine photo-lyase